MRRNRRGLAATALLVALATGLPAADASSVDHAHTDVLGGDGHHSIGEAFGSNISADGRFVAYAEDDGAVRRVVVEDRATGAVELVPAADEAAGATDPVLTPDGRFVVFSAGSPEAPTGVYVYDRRSGSTEPISVDSSGRTVEGGNPSISDDGRFVSFSTQASIDPTDDNGRDADGGAFATDVYLRDRERETTTLVSAAAGGGAGEHDAFAGLVSGDGRYVAFASRSRDVVAGDANGEVVDAFRWSVERRTTERIGLTSAGSQAPQDVVPTGISRDGRLVALTTEAALVPQDTDALPDGYVRDAENNSVAFVDASDLAYGVVLSADGRTVAFEQSGRSDDSDIIVHDLATGRRTQADIGPDGGDLRNSSRARLSADGRHVAMVFLATVPPESSRDSGVRSRIAVRELHGSLHVGMAVDRDGGYRAVTESGDVFALGGASWHGSTSHIRLRRPVVGSSTTPSGDGYWLVAADGGVFSFGDAPFRGSAASLPLRAPVVGMAATPSGDGYWLVAADGGVFSFGDAAFHGSTGALSLRQPVVAMADTPTGGGYWLAAADGGVFTFGDAVFRGSAAGTVRGTAVTGIAAPGPDGYWLIDGDGIVRAFGSAPDAGSR